MDGNEATVHDLDNSEMIIDKEGLTARRRTYSRDTLSTKNKMGNDWGVKQGLHIGKPMANRVRD